MKIRNGFVSNSSSSSFILLGLLFKDEVKDKIEDWAVSEAEKINGKEKPKYEIEMMDIIQENFSFPDTDEKIIGHYLLWGGEHECLEFKDLTSDIKKAKKHETIKKLLEITGKEKSDLRLYVGTAIC